MTINISKKTLSNEILHYATALSLLITIILIFSVGTSTNWLDSITENSEKISLGFWVLNVNEFTTDPTFVLNAAGISAVIFIALTLVLLSATLFINHETFKKNKYANIFLIASVILTLVVIIVLTSLRPSAYDSKDDNNSIWTANKEELQLNWKGILCLLATIFSLLGTVAFALMYTLSLKKTK
ncbi:MAG: hypothetical protein LBV53_02665 [Mycoplasmataceae bacterium]|jgi:hypothetical protein|nr:hypothetical protein [Mycoplasmataceae bacterium]